jgi:hypothetical protein
MAYGRQQLGTIGTSIQVSADGEPVPKMAGVTLDWTTFATVTGSDVTIADGLVIKIGQQYGRFGLVICKITTGGKYGPYDPAAADGRQTPVRGQCYVLNRTAIASEPADEYPEVIEGGRVWLARIIQAGTGTASLAAGPTRAVLDALFPDFRYVE